MTEFTFVEIMLPRERKGKISKISKLHKLNLIYFMFQEMMIEKVILHGFVICQTVWDAISTRMILVGLSSNVQVGSGFWAVELLLFAYAICIFALNFTFLSFFSSSKN